MRNFIYDENNHRLVLVSELFPELTVNGVWQEASPHIDTRSSRQQRLYNTLYVWEDIMLQEGKADNGMDHLVSKINEDLVENGKLMILASNDCNIIYGGAYIYNNALPKPKI